jgi:hypothetical protein
MRNLLAIVSLLALTAATACSSSSSPKTGTLPDNVPSAPDAAGGAGATGGATQMGTGGAGSIDALVAAGDVAGADGPTALDGSSVADAPVATGGVRGGDGPAALGGSSVADASVATGGVSGADGPTALGGSSVTDAPVATGGADARDASVAAGGKDAAGIVDASGTAGTTGTGGTGACSLPSCYTALISTCIPGGTCVEQMGFTTSPPISTTTNLCYGNGVKVLTSTVMTGTTPGTPVTTVTNGGTLCYSYEMPLSQAGENSATMVFKNAAGAIVATNATNGVARTVTITCTGGSPVVVSLDCFPSTDGGTPCTQGTCGP